MLKQDGKRTIILLLVFFPSFVWSQWTDTLQLPFAIAHEKRLSEEDLLNKKEGVYVVGIPDVSSDPVNGFGYGGEGSLFLNGHRSDPFFAYTAYRAKLDLQVFNTTRSQKELMLGLDMPYFLDSRWRLRLEAAYEKNPNLLYFGNTEGSLQGLSYFPHADTTQSLVHPASYTDYETNGLVGANRFYNSYQKEEFIVNVSGERSYLDGKLRALVGVEIAQITITTFEGNSLLARDFANKSILGLGKGLVSILQSGLIYDTRDLETDPCKGVFAEMTNEWSASYMGSAFDFNKTFFHFNIYQNLIRARSKKLVLAARVAGGYTAGHAPFFEFQDQWSSEGSIEGLGGAQTLRGYKQSRFLSRAMTFNNIELRYRFAQTTIFRQHLSFAAVPFADIGGVWNDISRMTRLTNYRYDLGLGLRIIWNLNTVLRFDYAISKEDKQFFFNLSHAF